MLIHRILFPFLQKRNVAGTYSELNSASVIKTIGKLEERILERFPKSGLSRVCADFLQEAQISESLALRLQTPIWPVRIAAGCSGFLLLGLFFWAVFQILSSFSNSVSGISDLLQTAESAINELIFLCLALYFLTNLEARLKRQSALRSLHRLRSIAHVVDMHQLTKDPAFVLSNIKSTDASPKRGLTKEELTRYLDYCSEMLALVSKIAALFAQNIEDPVVLAAVNDLESLTQGLSGKIWQKIMILDLALPKNPA
jgi:hypothetical protein